MNIIATTNPMPVAEKHPLDVAIEQWNKEHPQNQISDTFKELGWRLCPSFDESLNAWKITELGRWDRLRYKASTIYQSTVFPQICKEQSDTKSSSELKPALALRLQAIWRGIYNSTCICPIRSTVKVEDLAPALPLPQEISLLGKIIRVEEISFRLVKFRKEMDPWHIPEAWSWYLKDGGHHYCLVIPPAKGKDQLLVSSFQHHTLHFLKYMAVEYGIRARNCKSSHLHDVQLKDGETTKFLTWGITGSGSERTVKFIDVFGLVDSNNQLAINMSQEGLIGILSDSGFRLSRHLVNFSSIDEISQADDDKTVGGIILFSSEVKDIVTREFNRFARFTAEGLHPYFSQISIPFPLVVIISDYAVYQGVGLALEAFSKYALREQRNNSMIRENSETQKLSKGSEETSPGQ